MRSSAALRSIDIALKCSPPLTLTVYTSVFGHQAHLLQQRTGATRREVWPMFAMAARRSMCWTACSARASTRSRYISRRRNHWSKLSWMVLTVQCLLMARLIVVKLSPCEAPAQRKESLATPSTTFLRIWNSIQTDVSAFGHLIWRYGLILTCIFFRRVQSLAALIETHASHSQRSQIYNEEVNDLLQPKNRNLRIKADQESDIMVAGLSETLVYSPEQVMKLLSDGDAQRHVGETKMNDKSSRSHSIFKMVLHSPSFHVTDAFACAHGQHPTR